MSTIFKKFFSIFLSFVLICSMSLVIPTAHADSNNQLKVAEYIKSGEGQVNFENGVAKYSGEIVLNIPLAKVIEPFAPYMKQHPDNYPWSAKEKGQTASIQYNLKFPSGVNISDSINEITITNKVSFISAFNNSTKSQNILYKSSNNSLNFSLPLNQLNWGQLYDLYLNDMKNINEHTLKVTIPYTVSANSYKKAALYNSESITGNGSFSFSPAGGFFWGWFNQTYNTDVANLPLIVLSNQNKDSLQSYFPKPEIVVPNKSTTDNKPVNLSVNIGETLSANGKNIKNVNSKNSFFIANDGTLNLVDKTTLDSIPSSLKSINLENLNNISVSINKTFIFPSILKFENNNTKGTINIVGPDKKIINIGDFNSNSKNIDKSNNTSFDVKIANNELILDIAIENIKSLNDLNDKILTININNLNISGAETGESYKVSSLTEVKVVSNENSSSSDSLPSNTNNISRTILFTDQNHPYISLSLAPSPESTHYTKRNINLPGNLLVNGIIQQNSVYIVEKDQPLNFTGTLDVKGVKNEMASIEKKSNIKNLSGIRLSDIKTAFIATLTLPNEISFSSNNPANINLNLDIGNNNNFEIVKNHVAISGKTITVPMKLTDESITKYTTLQDIIKNAMPDELKLTVENCRFNSKSKPNTNYIVKGSMNAYFSATATINNVKNIFNLSWDAVQPENGQSFSSTTPQGIQLILRYKENKDKDSSKKNCPSCKSDKTAPVDKVYGKNRIETANKIAKKYFGKADTVILAVKDKFPDSLTATVLSEQLNAPILLTSTEKLDQSVANEIADLGASHVIIVGGPKSVSDNVMREIKDKFDRNAERIYGQDRYGTSEMVARKVVKFTGILNKAVVASGEVFPDALSISPFAANKGYPILLVKKNSVPYQIKSAVKDLDINSIYLIGGDNTVSQNAQKNLPNKIERIYGQTRYDTAIAIAKSKFSNTTHAFVASGEEFSDALVIGPVAGKYNEPILLTPSYELAALVNYINSSNISTLTVVGGPEYIPSYIFYLLNQ